LQVFPVLQIPGKIIKRAATAVGIVNKEPSFTDEVVVIFGDGEVIDGFLAWERGDGDDPAPGALHRLYKIAHMHLIRSEPTTVQRVAALDPEGMIDAGPQGRLLAFDAYFKQAGLVQRSERSDRLRLQLAGDRVARDHRVAFVNVLDGNVAVAGMHRRASGKAAEPWDSWTPRSQARNTSTSSVQALHSTDRDLSVGTPALRRPLLWGKVEKAGVVPDAGWAGLFILLGGIRFGPGRLKP